MSEALIASIKKNRELRVTVGKFVFTCRRPTDYEAAGLLATQILRDHVIGWSVVNGGPVTEADINPSAACFDPVPFSRELWNEWWPDRTDFWQPIADAVMKAYTDHTAEMEAAEKNSVPASS